MRLFSVLAACFSVVSAASSGALDRKVCAKMLAVRLSTDYPSSLAVTNLYAYIANRMVKYAARSSAELPLQLLTMPADSPVYSDLLCVASFRAMFKFMIAPGEPAILQAMLANTLSRHTILSPYPFKNNKKPCLFKDHVVLNSSFYLVDVLVDRLNADPALPWENAWMVTETAIYMCIMQKLDFATSWTKWSTLKNATLVRPESIALAVKQNRRGIADLLSPHIRA